LTQIRHNTVILVEFYVGQFFQLIFFKRKHELAPRAPSRQPSEGERRSVPTRGHDMSFFKRIHDVGVGLFSFNVLMRYWKLVRGSDTFQLCGKRRAFRRKRGPTRLLGLLVACWSFGCWLCLSVICTLWQSSSGVVSGLRPCFVLVRRGMWLVRSLCRLLGTISSSVFRGEVHGWLRQTAMWNRIAEFLMQRFSRARDVEQLSARDSVRDARKCNCH